MEWISRATLTDFSKTVTPYMLFSSSTCLLQVLSMRFEGLSPLLQLVTRVDVDDPLQGEKGMDIGALNSLASISDTLR